MKTTLLNKHSQSGFTLVEVVLAMSIFAFAGLTSMALYGTLLKNVSVMNEREKAVCLNTTLEDTINSLSSTQWNQIYSWVQSGTPVYAYTYLATASTDTSGLPDPTTSLNPWVGSGTVRLVPSALSNDTTNSSRLKLETAALQGTLYRVVLTVSKSNPVQVLPASASSYTEAILAVNASFYSVHSLTASTPSSTDIPVHRSTITFTLP